MNATHKIKITNSALRDLEAIARHVFRQSEQNAASVSDRLLEEIEGLKWMPERFKLVGQSQKKGFPVHALIVRPFIIITALNPRLSSC